MVKAFVKVFFLALVAVIVGGCGLIAGQEEGSFDFQGGRGRQELNIVAGSEIEVLEPIIEDYAEDQQMTIHIDYMGSLDMMNQLQTGQIDYDAVWPASSIWIDLGDSHKILKHEEVTSITPVIFGIRESLAQDLDLVEGEVYLEDIIQAIKEDQLSFAMTSATQSNSGATAYLGFLNALNGGQTLTEEDLQDDQLQEDIQTLLSAVDRSSGSSNWLVDLFLNGDYNAMVNYEQLILQTNEQLEDQGREPLALVYPKDALALSDSPLAYVDHGDDDKEQAFLAFQDYILSDEGQSLIEQTGKRSAFGTVRPENRELYDKWGADLETTLSPTPMPQADVIMAALQAYQTEFKKPAITAYVLDFSGSMAGQGQDQMMAALEQVMIPEYASQHLLQGTDRDITYLVPFSDQTYDPLVAAGNDQALAQAYDQLEMLEPVGNTYLFEAVAHTLLLMEDQHGDSLQDYQPAIVVLTDGEANGGMDAQDALDLHDQLGRDIPVFSILFGSASEGQLNPLAEGTQARVFDGRSDLTSAFKAVKGYN